MKLTIELTNDKKSFRILEQNTGYSGYRCHALYEDEDIAIFQRNCPAFHNSYIDSEMSSAKMVLYLRGEDNNTDKRFVYLGSDMLKVLYHLRKAFSDFTIIGADKFYLGE